VKVTLSRPEIELAAIAGVMRHAANLRRPDRVPTPDPWGVDIDGGDPSVVSTAGIPEPV
jgi:hypothetical protein